MKNKTDKQGLGGWLFLLLALLIAVAGVVLIAMGGKLIALGGSWYYALMGLALLVSGVLLVRRNSLAQEGLEYGARKEPWMSVLDTPCIAPPWGYVSGVDLRSQEVIWSRPLGTGYDQGPMGIPSYVKLELGTPNNGGSVSTAGGMTFIGASLDNFLRGFDTETGKLLWEARVPAGPQAAPMSYEVNGQQYIVTAVGGHERMSTKLGDSVIAYALKKK